MLSARLSTRFSALAARSAPLFPRVVTDGMAAGEQDKERGTRADSAGTPASAARVCKGQECRNRETAPAHATAHLPVRHGQRCSISTTTVDWLDGEFGEQRASKNSLACAAFSSLRSFSPAVRCFTASHLCPLACSLAPCVLTAARLLSLFQTLSSPPLFPLRCVSSLSSCCALWSHAPPSPVSTHKQRRQCDVRARAGCASRRSARGDAEDGLTRVPLCLCVSRCSMVR